MKATDHYTNLIDQLKSIPCGNSETDNQRGRTQAIQYVNNSDLPDNDKKTVVSTICKASNPSGWYTECNGVDAALNALESLAAESIAEPVKTEKAAPAQTHKASVAFNRKNLKNLVSDGKIFSVEFIKRSTGELRTMTARMGVTRHLRNGYKAYNPVEHNLLTVFDMNAKGYRSIPLETIQRLSVGGQTFNFAGV